jgi:hypothetical protein
MVDRSALAEALACRVTQAPPLAGKGRLMVRIKVPRNSTLRSIVLRTTSGELALEVMDAASLIGEYATLIDSATANCAASGTLVLEVEGDIENSSVACSDVPLFDPRACDESPSGRR